MTLNDQAAAFAAATDQFLQAARALSPAQLDLRQPAGWSARQVVHHLADSEAQSYARLRRLIAEPAGSVIQGYDEALWAANPVLGYDELPIEHSLAVFAAVRAASHDLLLRLSEADLARYGTHTESGRYTLADWLRNYTNHPLDHLQQLREAIGGS